MNGLEQAREEILRVDREMARLFERRMKACQQVGTWKRENHRPIRDPEREELVISRGAEQIEDPALRGSYRAFQREVIELSCRVQARMMEQDGAKALEDGACCLPVQTAGGEYPVYVMPGGLKRAGELFDLNRRVLVVTDSGVPTEYARTVAEQCKNPIIITIPVGESSKNTETWQMLQRKMLAHGMTRKDCVVAVGGGVVGDLSGFAAACFMRGVDFYNMPTTLLSQVDSSIGGKTAVDLDGVKNPVGAFWNPKAVLADPDTLRTLDDRQLAAGLAEAVKMAVTCDGALLDLIENAPEIRPVLPEIIRRSLLIKKHVVEEDPKEQGLRRVLNFGHTIGHAIEAFEGGKLLHGECVALGMLPMAGPGLRERLRKILRRSGLPVTWQGDKEELIRYMTHDKKAMGDTIRVVLAEEAGSFRFADMTPEELTGRMEGCL